MESTQDQRWHQLRMSIVTSQIAPTLLLITTVALLQFGLAESGLSTRVAAAGILLASGILGALVQFTSASEAQALATALPEDSALRSSARWMWVVKFVTPAVFTGIYVALLVALFASSAPAPVVGPEGLEPPASTV